jgi:hypothetical protein
MTHRGAQLSREALMSKITKHLLVLQNNQYHEFPRRRRPELVIWFAVAVVVILLVRLAM